jgi:N utilization substance protein B
MKIEMNRTEMRENAFKLIYSLEIQKVENVQEQINLYFESNNITDEEAKKYIANAVNGIEEHQEEILKDIETNLKEEWKLSRISKMDLTILKLAIYEIKFTDVPYKVSINEAVELAKKYGEDKSKNFVNGILASVVKEM